MGAIHNYASRLWHEMKEAYDRDWSAAYMLAEHETNGVLVNKAGKAKGIRGYELFSGPLDRAMKYASEELKDHWLSHKRPNLSEYEAQWLEAHYGIR